MDYEEFNILMQRLEQYLQNDKAFIYETQRAFEFGRAVVIAEQLFVENTITVVDDPLQMGALILCISGDDVVVRGKSEIDAFYDLISLADNFEIYPANKNNIRMAITFQNVFKRIN